MKIGFYGAARQVTGSKHLILLEKGMNVLLDCGMFQGRKKDSDLLNRHWGFDPRMIHAVILSHAHIDHSGLLPKLIKDGFSGKIFCTPATYDLCYVMLPDSGYIHESDAVRTNNRRRQKGKKEIQPLYTAEDAYHCLKYFEKVDYGQVTTVTEGFEFRFLENGHLLGSAAVYMEIKEGERLKKLTYTGDVGRTKPSMLREPEVFPQSDYIICESTYGDRLHDPDEYTTQDMVDLIRETCIINKGKLIIPAFSVGRTQEIIFALDYLYNELKLPEIDVYVDSPLSTKSTFIYKNHLELFNNQMQQYLRKDPDPFLFPRLHFVDTVEESKKLNTKKEPCIIISASGMMDAGRIRHHLANHIGNPNNTILIVGYCEPSTLGGKLIEGRKIVKIFGIHHLVKARIEYIRSYSGHGDYKELLNYLKCQNTHGTKQIFLVHGNYAAQLEFKTRLRRAGFKNINIPEHGQIIDLFEE